MSIFSKQVVENIDNLPSEEKALVAHCLISSLEAQQDEAVEETWNELAKQRFSELETGAVQGVSWDEIRKKVTE